MLLAVAHVCYYITTDEKGSELSGDLYLESVLKELDKEEVVPEKAKEIHKSLQGLTPLDQHKFGDDVVSKFQRKSLRDSYNSGNISMYEVIQMKKRSNLTDVLMSTYFVHQLDPLGRVRMKKSSNVLYKLHRRTRHFSHRAHIVVFVDWIDLVDKVAELPIEVVYINKTTVNWSINDYRYFLYLSYLRLNTQYQRALMVDLKDVQYGRDPFELMASMPEKKLFVGSQPDRNKYLAWMGAKAKQCFGGFSTAPQRIREAYHTLKVDPEKYVLTNAGIFGGDREYVVEILEYMNEIFVKDVNGGKGDNPRGCNANMLVFCGAIWPYYQQGLVFTGSPLHSPFRSYLDPTEAYAIFHK